MDTPKPPGAEGAAKPAAAEGAAKPAAPEAPKTPDPAAKRLEWIKAVAMPLASVFITIIGGAYVTQYTKDREARESNERLYTQLLLQREQSDATLRKDMFSVVLKQFLGESTNMGWDERVLQLELLANNFNQSLDLSPLFKDIARRLPLEPKLDADKRLELQARMDKTASALNFKQVTALSRQGFTADRQVEIDKSWEQRPIDQREVFDSALAYKTRPLREASDGAPKADQLNVRVHVMKVDFRTREIQVSLVVTGDALTDGPVQRTFWVSRYDFPMLDNTQLPGGLRAAVVLSRFEKLEDSAEAAEGSQLVIHLVVFPAASASLKDRQDYDEALEQMRTTKQQATAASR